MSWSRAARREPRIISQSSSQASEAHPNRAWSRRFNSTKFASIVENASGLKKKEFLHLEPCEAIVSKLE